MQRHLLNQSLAIDPTINDTMDFDVELSGPEDSDDDMLFDETLSDPLDNSDVNLSDSESRDESESDDASPELDPSSDDDDHDDLSDDSSEEGSLRATALRHSLWFVEQKFTSKCTEAQVTQSMRTARRLVEGATDDPDYLGTIPINFQQALNRTQRLVLGMQQIDACVKDHYLFRDDDMTVCPVANCGEPRYKRNGTARRAAFYVKPEEWLTQLLSVVKLCKQFEYMKQYVQDGKFRGEADDELRDFLSGSIYTEVIEPYIRRHGVDTFKTVLCGLCHDEVEISRWPKKNICPILLCIFNVPPWIRNLLTMIFMVGIMPTNCKNAQLYLEPVVEMFKDLKPGSQGFPVVSPVSGLTENWYAMLAMDLNDMRGVSKGNCQVQTPAKVMACNDCAVRGYWVKCYNSTFYPCAVTFLPPDDALRAEYKNTFQKCSVLRKLADQPHPPRFITDEYVRLAMDLAEDSDKEFSNKSHPAWKYGFFERSVFVKHLDYWRPWMMNLRDTDHMLLNRLRLIINILSGVKSMSMKPERMAFENSLGRFLEYGPITRTTKDGKSVTTWPDPPWRALPEEIDFIDSVLPDLVRLPQTCFDGKFPRFFSDKLTFSHANLFFSGIGLIIIALCPTIAEPQREALVALIEATSHVLMPVLFGRELPDLQYKMARAQTLCEMRLPISFSTMASHALLEIFIPERGRIARTGANVYTHMAAYERFNKLLRQLMTQFKAPAKHIMLSLLRLNMVEMVRVREPLGYFPSLREGSSILGALHAGAFHEEDGPDYISADTIIRKLGRFVTRQLTTSQSEKLHAFFLEDRSLYQRAHSKLKGN